jgi:RNA polymerase sigma-70 factor (ECF subfamily)
MTNLEILHNIQHGDDNSWDAFMKSYMGRLGLFVKNYTQDRDEIDDIIQETFLKAWKNIRKFDAEKNIAYWLLTIAKNTALDMLRKKKRAVRMNMEDADMGDIGNADNADSPNLAVRVADEDLTSLFDAFDQAQNARLVKEAISSLSEREKMIITMHYYDELSFELIGELIGESSSTVRSRHRRAVHKLRSLLKR